MKTFFIIIGTIIIIVFALIMYLYQNITYQPDHVQDMEVLDLRADEEIITESFARIKDELQQNSVTYITADDLNNLIKYGITQEEDARVSESIKKIHSSIKDNVVTVEAVVNISTLADVKVSSSAEPFINFISSKLPTDYETGELYVAFEGEPYNEDGMVKFRAKPSIRVGDFSQDVFIDHDDKDFEIERIFLDDLRISDFVMKDDRIQIVR